MTGSRVIGDTRRRGFKCQRKHDGESRPEHSKNGEDQIPQQNLLSLQEPLEQERQLYLSSYQKLQNIRLLNYQKSL